MRYLEEDYLGTPIGCGIFIPANQTLYDLVSCYPSNREVDQIASKLLIIGRSYAASIERRRNKQENETVAAYYAEVATGIAASGLEEMLRELPPEGRLEAGGAIDRVVAAHALLCRIISGYMGKDCSSFASKYLHFHRPHHFPIMDSRARAALKWVADDFGFHFAPNTAGSVGGYRKYCEAYLKAKAAFEARLRRRVSLRQVDNVLISRYDNGV